MIDKKEWISNRAEEISQNMFERDFYSNGPHIQLMLWLKAEEDYADYYASQIDAAYDRWKEEQLMG